MAMLNILDILTKILKLLMIVFILLGSYENNTSSLSRPLAQPAIQAQATDSTGMNGYPGHPGYIDQNTGYTNNCIPEYPEDELYTTGTGIQKIVRGATQFLSAQT